MATPLSVLYPRPVYYDPKTNLPLNSGYIHVGQPNKDPLDASNKVQVYYDVGLTIKAPNPLRTSNGFILNGSNNPTSIFIDGTDYSITITDSTGSSIVSSPTADYRYTTGGSGQTPSFTTIKNGGTNEAVSGAAARALFDIASVDTTNLTLTYNPKLYPSAILSNAYAVHTTGNKTMSLMVRNPGSYNSRKIDNSIQSSFDPVCTLAISQTYGPNSAYGNINTQDQITNVSAKVGFRFCVAKNSTGVIAGTQEDGTGIIDFIVNDISSWRFCHNAIFPLNDEFSQIGGAGVNTGSDGINTIRRLGKIYVSQIDLGTRTVSSTYLFSHFTYADARIKWYNRTVGPGNERQLGSIYTSRHGITYLSIAVNLPSGASVALRNSNSGDLTPKVIGTYSSTDCGGTTCVARINSIIPGDSAYDLVTMAGSPTILTWNEHY